MKTLLLKISLFLIITAKVFSSEIDTPPEALLYQYLENPDDNAAAKLLDIIINNKRNKKWPRLPYVHFLKSGYFFSNDNKEQAIDELKYLIKKYPGYIEPWLELLYFYISENKMEDGYNLSRKAPLKATTSITELSPFRKSQPYPEKEYLQMLLFYFNIIFEFDKKKARRIKKSIKRYNSFISENKVITPDIKILPHLSLTKDFFTIFLTFQKGNIPQTRKLIKEMLTNNWKEEECIFNLLLINKVKPFQDFFIKEKERNAYDIWKIIWNDNRRNWQKNRWQELFQKNQGHFLTLKNQAYVK